MSQVRRRFEDRPVLWHRPGCSCGGCDDTCPGRDVHAHSRPPTPRELRLMGATGTPRTREAAKAAFTEFLSDATYSANQLEFVNMIIDHLTQHGVLEPDLLYESPFTDLTPQGPHGLFESTEVDNLISVLEKLKRSAHAA